MTLADGGVANKGQQHVCLSAGDDGQELLAMTAFIDSVFPIVCNSVLCGKEAFQFSVEVEDSKTGDVMADSRTVTGVDLGQSDAERSSVECDGGTGRSCEVDASF
jgi:hypothetical protein